MQPFTSLINFLGEDINKKFIRNREECDRGNITYRIQNRNCQQNI